MIKHSKNDSGIALLFTLILVAIFFILGMAFMSRANFSARMSRNFQETEEARLAANLALENFKSNLTYSFTRNYNLTGADQAYGYTYPTWEAKRLYDNDWSDYTNPGTVFTGTHSETGYAALTIMHISNSGGVMAHGYERGFRSLLTGNGDRNNYTSETLTKHSIFGNITNSQHTIVRQNQFDASWTGNKTGQAAPWDTQGTDGEFRNGYRSSYIFIDKTGLIDINMTKQTQDPNDVQSYSDLQTADAGVYYSNCDLSKIPGWEMSAHDPKTNGILNFDELYGRKNLGATAWEIAPPSSLSDCNDNPTTIPRPQLSRDGTTDLSYKFITSPYSVPETFPAYNGGAYSTISTSKPHTRFDLSTLTRDGATIDDVMSVPDLLTQLPYLNNWTNSLQKETVAANILDYADEGLKVTTNHSPGATITSTTYCGNERVPALNEICIGLVNRATGSGSELYAKAELLWLYDTVAPVGMNYEVKFKVNVTATGAGFTNGSYTLTATGLNTTTPASLPASIDQEHYLVSSTARKTFTNTTPLTYFNIEIEAVELYVNGVLADIAQPPAATAKGWIGTGSYSHYYCDWEAKDPRNNTHSSSWQQVANWGGGWGGFYTQNRDTYATFPCWSGEGSFYMPNASIRNDYNATTAINKDYEKNLDAPSAYFDYNGTGGSARNAITYLNSSHRYMPTSGINHEIELGSISRGVDYQTLNLSSYNLDTSNLANAQFKPSNDDDFAKGDGTLARFYDPLAGGSSKISCNGGDRQILDEVYVATNSLNDISKEKEIYGKISANSTRVNALKTLLLSMGVPSSTSSPDTTTPVSAADAATWANFFNWDGDYITQYPRFMTKFTYDKLAPISANNAPSDPMRWGSKRLGSLFDRDVHDSNSALVSPFNDREREVLLSKMKDYLTVRYTYYSGIMLSESMLYKASSAPGFQQVTNAVDANDAHPARDAIYGKTLSQQQYRVELAYDHFLDKITVLDYKFMGKHY